MIRKLENRDIDKVAQIWLEVNIEAHNFISENYWKERCDEVKGLLLQAQVYVYENHDEIIGFIGLMENHIAGIFVSNSSQSKGVGKNLLDYVKSHKETLMLNVYIKNERAKKFYEREQFSIKTETFDETTLEKEFLMEWKLF